jgi:hypothetical protein
LRHTISVMYCNVGQSNRDKLLACPLGVCRQLAGRAVSASGAQRCIGHIGTGPSVKPP